LFEQLLFDRIIQNLPSDWFKGWRGAVARLDGICAPIPGAPREWRASFLNRRAARAALQTILAWPIDRVLNRPWRAGDRRWRNFRAPSVRVATWKRTAARI